MIAAAASQLGRAVRAALLILFALAAALLAAGSILSWRLAQGPLDVGWLARRIEAAANQPGEPARFSIGRAQIQWAGFANGASHGLELQLNSVAVAGPDGTQAASVRWIDLTVSLPRLLLGQIVPRALAASGLDLSLTRDANGHVVLDLGGLPVQSDASASGPTLSETLAELARPARIPGTRPQRPDLQHLEELQSVQLTSTVLHLHDAALGNAVEIDLSSVDLRRQRRGGMLGAAEAAVGLGAARTTATLQADLAANGGTRMQLTFTPVNAATVQSADPALATADGLDAAVGGNATLELDAALHPTAAAISLQSGGGQLRLAGAAIGFDGLNLDAQAAWDRPGWTVPQHLAISRARAVVQAPGGAWPTTITAAAAVSRGAGSYAGTVEGTVDHLAFADIPRLWPKPLGGHVRPWLVANVTAGVARDGALKASFEARPDLSAINLTAIDATARGEDVTVWWLRPAPPVEGAQATLSFHDPEVLDIAITTARQGPVALGNGLVHFTGMADKDQFMALGADLSGNVADIFTLLKNPALQLLSKSPVAIRNPSGALTGHLTVNLPMRDVVPFEEVRIGTSAKLTDLHLGGLVAGRDLDHATAQLDAGSDGLHTSGRGLVAGVPADLAVDMDFRPGPPSQIVQKATATARASRAQLAIAGFDPGSLMSAGSALLTAQYAQHRDGTADLAAAADLHDAALTVAGWTKPPDAPAELHAHLLIRRDHLAGIDTFGATGPGLFASGHADTPADAPVLVTLDRLSLGRTEAHGQIRLPTPTGGPARITLSGAVLDLAPALKSSLAQTAGSGTPWIADLQFDHLLLTTTDSPGLTGVAAHAENDGRILSFLNLSSAAPEQLRATLRPDGHARRLSLGADDGGGVLRATGLLGTLNGGHLTLAATLDDAGPGTPIAGTAELTGFQLRDAPVLGKLLQAATIYGVVDALRGPGLLFSDLVMPFHYADGVLQIDGARAFSSSLGLTAHGTIDTAHDHMDLQGTVVPAYVLNSMLGRIPLIGRVFSAEQGGGLVAVNYALRGAIGNPGVSVNPLSALTPGFLRGLFHIFG